MGHAPRVPSLANEQAIPPIMTAPLIVNFVNDPFPDLEKSHWNQWRYPRVCFFPDI